MIAAVGLAERIESLGRAAQIDEQCAMLEAYSKVDQALAELKAGGWDKKDTPQDSLDMVKDYRLGTLSKAVGALELLEALKTCLLIVEHLAATSAPSTIKEARAAIAKAEGAAK